MAKTHFNRSGSGVPACLNGTRAGQTFRLTAVYAAVTCKKCLREVALIQQREGK